MYEDWKLIFNNPSANHLNPLGTVGMSAEGIVLHWHEEHWYSGTTRTEIVSLGM